MQTSIDKEVRINQPYWRKINSSLSPEQLRSCTERQDQARKVLAATNKRIPVRMVEDYLGRLNPNSNQPDSGQSECSCVADAQVLRKLRVVFDACRVLRIPFQMFVDGKLPDHPLLAKAAEEVAQLRLTDLGLPKVKAAKDVAEYFLKLGKPQGAQVTVYGGLTKASEMLREIRAQGVNVTLEGAYANRVATFKHLTEKKRKKRYKPKAAGGSIDPRKWSNSVEAEVEINEPYWAKFITQLSPAEAAALPEELQRAQIDLIRALHANGGMFDAEQVIAYETGKEGPERLVSKALAACETLRIPFQCVASTPVSENIGYPKAVEDFRQMDLGLKKFDGFGPMAEYFRSPGKKVAVLTAGPELLVAARKRANNNRIVVQISGAHGNRLVRLVRYDDSTIETRNTWRRSGRNHEANDDEFVFSNRYHLLAPGKRVYMEGHYATLMRSMCRTFGPHSCTASKTANKKGWHITLRDPTEHGNTP